MKSGLKVKKRQKKSEKSRKKNFNFFLFMRFYLERRNVTNKKGLFHAKFFDFSCFFLFFITSALAGGEGGPKVPKM